MTFTGPTSPSGPPTPGGPTFTDPTPAGWPRPAGPHQYAPLLRRPEDRVFRGVCAAVGRATGTDPVLWRVALVVLTLFGGSGLVLYAAGWLLIPEQGQSGSIAERFLRGRQPVRPVVLVLIGIAALAVAGSNNGTNGVLPLMAVGLILYLVLHRGPVAPPEGPVADWSSPSTLDTPPQASWYQPLATYPVGTVAPPRPPRSPLVLLTVSAAALLVGLLLALHGLGWDAITPARVLAAALLVVGGGLLVGTFWGRGRLLIPLAALLVVALGATSTLGASSSSFSAGKRTWNPHGTSTWELGAGEATLNLADVEAPSDVTARMGVGHLILVLPKGVPVRLVGTVRTGDIVRPAAPKLSGQKVTDDETFGAKGQLPVTVHVNIGAGQLEVRNG